MKKLITILTFLVLLSATALDAKTRYTLWTRPTFVSCSVEMNCPKEMPGLKLEYRKVGEKAWKEAEILPFFATQPGYRTSIFRLEEDTKYECQFVLKGKRLCKGSFTTWKSDVPVAKTIELNPDKLPIYIKEGGTRNGWVRYTAPEGAVFCNNGTRPTIIVDGVDYILIDGLECQGPQIHDGVISVKNSTGVRIQNCDIYDFGRLAPVNYEDRGVPQINGKNVNFDGAIKIHKGCSEVVVERCYIHDSFGKSNSWRYAHPAGTEAVILYRPDHSTVIRYNDFIGSDLHRFNDAVESQGNFAEDGGFNRDADIYGNFMIFCNDDCIELDGGQRNVRLFDNRFEGALVGPSIQGCMVSPSFSFDNIISGLGDEFGMVGSGFKTGGGRHGPEAKTYIWNNTWWNKSGGFNNMEALEAHLWNNTFAEGCKIRSLNKSPKSTAQNNKMNVKMTDADIPVELPARPCPFILSAARESDLKDGYTLQLKALPELKGEQPWRVRRNFDMDWFEVSPDEGVLHPGETVTLTVHLDPDKIKDRRVYRSAFIVRTPEGLSRPFSFYVNTDYVTPFRPEIAEDDAVFVDVFNPVSGEAKVVDAPDTEFGKVVRLPDGEEGLVYEFSVPKEGPWWIKIRARGMTNGYVQSGVDGDYLSTQLMTFKDYMSWAIVAPGKKQGNRISCWNFAPGQTHRICIRKAKRTPENFEIEGIVVTRDPAPFEPR